MSTLDSKAGISKPPRAKPTANASNYRQYPIFLADLRAKISYISPKEESEIRIRFFNWINENRRLEIWKCADEKRKKFFEIANTILTISRSHDIFDNLSDLDPDSNEYSSDFSDIQCNLPEVSVKWMIEKVHKKVEIQSHDAIQKPFKEPTLFRTLHRIYMTDLIIQNYLYGSYKN
jgi:hypothetical protein